MKNIIYKKIDLDSLAEYDQINFAYSSNKKYIIKKLNRGLAGFSLELVDIPTYNKNFEVKTSDWCKNFDISNWKFFGAYYDNEIIAGCVVATKTKDCHMLEGREDLAVIWDIRVKKEYQNVGIGQKLFTLAKEEITKENFKQLKVECQNTNYKAVNFYHKQGMELCAINEYAYKDYPEETQLLWYLDLK